MKIDKPLLIYQIDPFLGWLESHMLHRGPRITVTEHSVSFFQALMRCARAHGHVSSSGRCEMISAVTDGFVRASKVTSCHAGLETLLSSVLHDLLLEHEPHIELFEFCTYLIEALGVDIEVRHPGKKSVQFRSSAAFASTEGVAFDVTMPSNLREAIAPFY